MRKNLAAAGERKKKKKVKVLKNLPLRKAFCLQKVAIYGKIL